MEMDDFDVEETFDYVNFHQAHILADLTMEVYTYFPTWNFTSRKNTQANVLEHI